MRFLFEERSETVPLARGALHGANPPGYYVLALWWRNWFGSSVEALRALSAVLAIAQAALLHRFLGKLRVPLFGVVLYALADLSLTFGSVARGYALAGACLLIAACASIGTPSARKGWTVVLASAGAVLSHYFAVFSVGGLATIWGVRHLRNRTRLTLLPAAALAALGAAAAGMLLRVSSLRQKQMSGAESLPAELGAFVQTAAAGFTEAAKQTDSAVALAVASFVWAPLLAGLVRAVKQHSRDDRLQVAAVMFACQAGGIAAAYFLFEKTFTAPQGVRYIGIALPAAAAVASYGIDWAPRRLAAGLFAAFLTLEASGVRLGRDRPEATARKVAALAHGRILVVGAGHGRGVPGSIVYEAKPSARICIITGPDSCREYLDGAVVVQSWLHSSPRTEGYERAFARDCRSCETLSTAEAW